MDRRDFLKKTAMAAAATVVAASPLAAGNPDYPQRESEWQGMNFIR